MWCCCLVIHSYARFVVIIHSIAKRRNAKWGGAVPPRLFVFAFVLPDLLPQWSSQRAASASSRSFVEPAGGLHGWRCRPSAGRRVKHLAERPTVGWCVVGRFTKPLLECCARRVSRATIRHCRHAVHMRRDGAVAVGFLHSASTASALRSM